MDAIEPVNNPFVSPITNVNVRILENGYVLTVYSHSRPIEWYCINLEEVMEKMSRYI